MVAHGLIERTPVFLLAQGAVDTAISDDYTHIRTDLVIGTEGSHMGKDEASQRRDDPGSGEPQASRQIFWRIARARHHSQAGASQISRLGTRE